MDITSSFSIVCDSCPSVVLVIWFDSLHFPKVACGQTFRLRVSSTDTFSDICVVQSLSVTEEFVAKGKSERESKCDSSSSSEVIGIEVVLTLLSRVVAKGEHGTECSHCEAWDTSKNVKDIIKIERLHVEMVWIPLDEVNPLNFAQHLFVCLLHIVFVSSLMMTVTTHAFLLTL